MRGGAQNLSLPPGARYPRYATQKGLHFSHRAGAWEGLPDPKNLPGGGGETTPGLSAVPMHAKGKIYTKKYIPHNLKHRKNRATRQQISPKSPTPFFTFKVMPCLFLSTSINNKQGCCSSLCYWF